MSKGSGDGPTGFSQPIPHWPRHSWSSAPIPNTGPLGWSDSQARQRSLRNEWEAEIERLLSEYSDDELRKHADGFLKQLPFPQLDGERMAKVGYQQWRAKYNLHRKAHEEHQRKQQIEEIYKRHGFRKPGTDDEDDDGGR